MTILASGEVRGFFDPIAIGLHLPVDPAELGRYSDDVAATNAATMIHEVTHYLQFFGTVFGYTYLWSMRDVAKVMATGIASKAQDHQLQFPASNWPIDLHALFQSAEDREFYTLSILFNRYFNEELYGLTYTHFGGNLPISDSRGGIVTSPLHLEQADGSVLTVTGEVLLENHASCNEVQFLGAYPSSVRDRLIQNMYLDLPSRLQARYLGYGVWLGTHELTHLEPIIYFVLFNQPMTGFLESLGEYRLVRDAKTILTYAHRYRDLDVPRTDAELREVVDAICKATNLTDPFHALSELHTFLAERVAGCDEMWSVDWIAHEIIGWTLNNRLESVLWPQRPLNILNSVPFFNVQFGNAVGNTVRHVLPSGLPPDQYEILVLRHLEYVRAVQLIVGLYNSRRVRCPHWVRVKPRICESCASCSGFLPDSGIGEDCPVVQSFGVLGLTRRVGRENAE